MLVPGPSLLKVTMRAIRSSVGHPEGFLFLSLLFWSAITLLCLWPYIRESCFSTACTAPSDKHRPLRMRRGLFWRFLGCMIAPLVPLFLLSRIYLNKGRAWCTSSNVEKSLQGSFEYVNYEGSYIIGCFYSLIERLCNIRKQLHLNKKH